MTVREYIKHGSQMLEVTGSDAQIVNALPTENHQVLFADPANQGALKATADRMANRLVVVNSDTEVSTAQNTVEDFSVVFSQWQRVAIMGNNPRYNLAELDNWTYTAGTDTIAGINNTATVVGFVSQRQIPGDYSFEVEVESTNGDDDFIGIFLGYVEINGVCHTLSAVRNAGANGLRYLWGLYLDFQGHLRSDTNTTEVVLASGNYDLIYPDGVLRTEPPSGDSGWGGWAQYAALGLIKIKAQLSGSVLTIQTSNPGQDYSAASLITFDLNSREDTKKFLGGTKIGYMAESQAECTWKSVTRPGSRADYVDTRTMTAWSYNGSSWVQATGAQLANYIQVGRHYYNDQNRKLYYYDPQTTTMVLVAQVNYDFATDQQVIDGVASNLLVSPKSLRALYDHTYP